jgi:ribosome-associated protein
MARRSRKGYYVEGTFIAAGSKADQQFRNELQGSDEPSRTARKEASEHLQDLGEALLTLRGDLFAGLPLPEKLRDALAELKRLTNLEGRRRQKQFIGKLMRGLDTAALDAIAAALGNQQQQAAEEARRFQQIEQWRDGLLADDARLSVWLQQFPATDAQQLRALVRQARKDMGETRAGEQPRRGRAYRQLFIMLREQFAAALASDAGAGPGDAADRGDRAN